MKFSEVEHYGITLTKTAGDEKSHGSCPPRFTASRLLTAAAFFADFGTQGTTGQCIWIDTLVSCALALVNSAHCFEDVHVLTVDSSPVQPLANGDQAHCALPNFMTIMFYSSIHEVGLFPQKSSRIRRTVYELG